MMLQVLRELAYIPEGATVVKRGGTYEHTVKDKIVIYADDPELTQTIKPAAGYRFIIGDDSHSINMVEVGKYFIWHTCLEELNELAEKEEAQRELAAEDRREIELDCQ